MINKLERQNDILRVIEDLDIPPSMYDNAHSKYLALAKYLKEHCELDVVMYPQGSFAYGTVIRPYNKDANSSYDLDFICEVSRYKDEVEPEELSRIIKEAISSGELYGGKMKESVNCITIQYADINNTSFSIDVVPAAHETNAYITDLCSHSNRPDLMNTAIAIPEKCGKNYKWITNNPKGFIQWFNEINRPYLNSSRALYRKHLFDRSNYYSKIEDIPAEMERSSIQRVIQILKYHRNIYYKDSKIPKPISAIITKIVTDVAASLNPMIDTFELLEFVIDELIVCSKLLHMPRYEFEKIYGSDRCRQIQLNNHMWKIMNPANPNDNLADKWNTDSNIPQKFFKWVDAVKKDLLDSRLLPDKEFRICSENAFGKDVINKLWDKKYGVTGTTPITIMPKPWKKQ